MANQHPVFPIVLVQVEVQVYRYSDTSLVEGEAGIVVAAVSLLGAAGGVVLTAVTPNGGS